MAINKTTRVRVIRTVIDNAAQRIVFTVGDAGKLVVDMAALPADIREYAAYHGIKQKIADAAALGADSTDDAKLHAMTAVANQLAAGDWSIRGNGDGEGRAPAGIRFTAYSRWVVDQFTALKQPVPSPDAIRAKWDKMDKKQQAAAVKLPAIAAIMDELRAAKTPATSPAMADELLAGF